MNTRSLKSFTSVLKTAAALAAMMTAPTSAETADFVPLPLELEVELALSALPSDLREDAAIYIRDPNDGFVLYREGSNGWMTFVARTSPRFYEAEWDFGWPSDVIIPQAHDEVGQAHHVKPYFDLALMRIAGTPADEAKAVMRQRFEDGTYTAPEKGGLSYMLAPIHRAYLAPAQSDRLITVSFPHHMPYAPNMPTSRLGTMDPHFRSGTLDHGGQDTGPHGYMYFMVQPDQVAAIQEEYAELLTKLCDLHDNWCLPNQ